MMDKSAADAYVYAKVCGMLSKAYSGKNVEKLYAAKSLAELYGLLFTDEVPAVPENILAKTIEEKAVRLFIDGYCSLVECYERPQKILVSLLQFYDYTNLKTIAGALCLKETSCPDIINLGEYALLHYDKWPDIEKITEGTELAWYNKVPDIAEQQALDTRLDFQYLRAYWNSASRTETSVRAETKSLFAEEIRMRNIIWAMRLKVYYKMESDEILSKLFFDSDKAGENDLFAGEAARILSKDFSSYDDWKDWKYRSSLNPHEEGTPWEVDPRWVENSFRETNLKRYSSAFHKFPLTSLSLVCYFKVKQDELDNIRRVTEGLRLGGE